HGSRGKIAAALHLDVLIDDRAENCLDVATESQARPVLIWRDSQDGLSERARQLGISVVPSIGECLEILEQLDDEANRDPGFMDRFNGFLGLKTRGQVSKSGTDPLPATAAISGR